MYNFFASNDKLLKIYDKRYNPKFSKLINELLILESKNEKIISILGWEFDITATIYKDATYKELKSGFEFLLKEEIPLDIFLRAFLIRTINEQSVKDKPVEFDNDLVYAKSEPEVLELLRLCFWIERSKNTITTYNHKFSEVKDQLEFGGKKNLDKKFSSECKIFSKILLDPLIPIWEKEIHKIYFFKILDEFRFKISSFLSEIMLAVILKEYGFDVEFPILFNDKRVCDLIINSFNAEVKTIFDQSKNVICENTLNKEILETLKRKKIINPHINDALSKNPHMIFLNLTFSSCGISINDSVANGNCSKSIKNIFDFSLNFIKSNLDKYKNKSLKSIPVVIFATGINGTDKVYQLSLILVLYPIIFKNNNMIADSKILNNDCIYNKDQ